MKLGIILDNLGPSQLAYNFIRNTNAFLAERYDTDVVVFYESLQPPCLPPNFSIMPSAEAWSFDGILVATSLSTAVTCLKVPSAIKKAFFAYDLEWVRNPLREFRDYQNIYGNLGLTLLARGQSHADAIASAWNRRPTVVGELDPESLLEALR